MAICQEWRNYSIYSETVNYSQSLHLYQTEIDWHVALNSWIPCDSFAIDLYDDLKNFYLLSLPFDPFPSSIVLAISSQA